MKQLNIPFASVEAEERAARESIFNRLTALEAAALAIGIKWDEVGGRVLRALGHLCGSRRQMDAGLSGLRWAGPVSELAEDKMVQASVVRVRVVLARLEDAGILTRAIRTNFRGQVDGLILTLDMTVINRLANPRNRPLEYPLDSAVDNPVEYPLDRVHHLDSVYTPRIPVIPNTPPPPKESQPTSLPVAFVATRPAADVFHSESGTESLAKIERDLRSIGIERAKPLALEFAQRAVAVSEAVQVFRAHRTRFSGPGAVVDFLRCGAWPVDGIKSIDEMQLATSKAAAKRLAADLERQRFAEARASPMQGWSDEELAILKKLGVPV